MNDDFKAKLAKLIEEKNKGRHGSKVQSPPVSSNEIHDYLEIVNHRPSASTCSILHSPPPTLQTFLPTLPPRRSEVQRPPDDLPAISLPRAKRTPPPPPPPRLSDTQNSIPDPHDNVLRPLNAPPIPPRRTNDVRKTTPKRILSSHSFRRHLSFIFGEKEHEETKCTDQESAKHCTPETTDANQDEEKSKSPKTERFDAADVDAYLLLEPAMAALNIGLSKDEVKRAIKEKLESTGSGFESSDDLIEHVLKLKEKETEYGIPRQVSEIEIQLCLRSEPALAALNLGLSLGRVKQAIRDKLERTGCGFFSKDALIEAALDIPEEEGLFNSVATIEKKKRSDEDRLCIVCMDAEIRIVFVPCGHLVTCLNCSTKLKTCPKCRHPIESTVKAYLP